MEEKKKRKEEQEQVEEKKKEKKKKKEDEVEGGRGDGSTRLNKEKLFICSLQETDQTLSD